MPLVSISRRPRLFNLPAFFGRPSRIRLSAAPALLLCIGLPLHAQIGSNPPPHPGATPAQTSTLPATPPTTATAPATAARPPAPAHRAEVLFANGQLTVRADNSSLHQILYSISQLTGMTINGGVEDQRVFGSYGPGDASTILATLLDGTGVNLFIREGDSHQPTELILTPRSGGPAPAVTAKDAEIGSSEPVAPSNSPAVSEPAPGDSAPTASNTASTPAAAQPGSGPLTPAEVYQKILDMQKARSGASSPEPPSSAPSQGAGNPQ